MWANLKILSNSRNFPSVMILYKMGFGGAALLGLMSRSFHSISTNTTQICSPGGVFDTFVRYNVRNHFPRPRERKRIKVHGWNKRMSTPGGQRVLMNRILKGYYVYSH